MKKLSWLIVLALLLVSVTAALADTTVTASFGAPKPAYPKSFENITPTLGLGNFVSSDDDQVCYDMSALGLIGEVTSEMRGFKIDPPVNYNDGNIDTILSTDGKFLAWASEPTASVLAFIIKGGPNYYVYDYVGSGLAADSWLASPLNKKSIPQISHYNVCYEVQDGTQGCTPGYWRNHADRWEGAAPSDDFDATFGVDLFDPNITLGTAINNPQTYGTFAFHAVAALLNSYGGVPNADSTTVDYPYTTAEVIQMVQDAVNTLDDPDTTENEQVEALEAVKNLLAAANELGCPLGGTKAVKVQ
jgi:hypothetical protein